MKPRMSLWRIGNLQRPSHGVGHMHAVPPGGNHGQHIRFQRIARHDGTRGAVTVAGENGDVGGGRLV